MRATGAGAEIEQFALDSPMVTLTAAGEIEDWSDFRYRLGTQGQVDPAEIARIFTPETEISGSAVFNGRIEGKGIRFVATGTVNSDELLLAGVRLRGLRADQTTVTRAEQLSFRVNRTRIQGIAIDRTRATDVTLDGLSGVVVNGRARIETVQADIKRAEMSEGHLSGITLRDVGAMARKGEYQVGGDLTIDSGQIGGAALGQLSGQLLARTGSIAVDDFAAEVLGGRADGDLLIATARGGVSRVKMAFESLATVDLFSLIAKQRAPLAGTVSGEADLSWPEMNLNRLSGAVNARFTGQVAEVAGTIPVSGDVMFRAHSGVFDIDRLKLATDASTAVATGRLAPGDDSNLWFSVSSTRAEQLQIILDSFAVMPEALARFRPRTGGGLKFEGSITGALDNPTIEGDLNLARVSVREHGLGALSGHFVLSPAEIRFENGLLTEADGGQARFTYTRPRATATAGRAGEGRLDAVFERIDLIAVLAAIGLAAEGDSIAGQVSGEAHLTGLPESLQGRFSATLIEGVVAGQPVETASANIVFSGQIARLENAELRLPRGRFLVSGSFDLKSNDFQVQGRAENLELGQLVKASGAAVPSVTGIANVAFQASGRRKKIGDLNVDLTALSQDVVIGGREAGELRLAARTTPGGRLDLDLVTGIAGKPQQIRATIDLRWPAMPVEVESDLENFEIAPLLAVFAPRLASSVSGTVSGRLRASGPLVDDQGDVTLAGLRGSLLLTNVSLQVQGNPINIETPVTIALTGSEVATRRVRIFGQGTDLRFGGRLGLSRGAGMDFSLSGTVNFGTLSILAQDTTLGGQLVVDVRVSGAVDAPRLSGEILLRDISYLPADFPVDIVGANGRIVLSGDRIRLENFAGNANDGTLRISGAMTLARFLQPGEWSFDIEADGVEFFYLGARLIANSNLSLRGSAREQALSGSVTILEGEYLTDFDLGELVSQGGWGPGFEFSAAGPASHLPGPPVRLDVRIEARESILIRNEQVNTVASALLNVTGTLSNTDVSGNVTLEGGRIQFRGQRYEITTGTIFLPGGAGAAPTVNLLAEADITGYHVYVGFEGPLDSLEVTLRSEPQLARAEILSLITTGRTEAGLLAGDQALQSGLTTAASLLSEQLVLDPIGREAERLLGLSRFQLDPVIRPNANPAARLTISRNTGRDLSLTYSTNLASEQDQTVSFQYDISNRFTAIASYLQGGSAAREGSDDAEFTIDFRGRKRFALGAGFPRDVGVGAPPPGAARRLPRPARPPVEVTVDRPEDIRLGSDKLRELLPIMREGFSRALMRLGERNLMNYLQERGYFFAEVDARCVPADCSGPHLQVRYNVQPGRRYDLEEIRIEGSNLLTKRDLQGDLQSKEDSFIGGIPFFENLPYLGGLARGITSNDRLRRDRAYVRRRLADLGYRSARVASRLAVSPDGEKLVVIFAVEEGPRSIIEEITLRGNTVLSSAELRRQAPIKEGEPFSLTSIRQGAQQINRLYAQHGYLDATTELFVEDLPNNRARLIYDVTEGTQAVVQELAIAGQAVSQEEAIRRFLAFAPGDVITQEKIRRTQQELYATGAFREVRLNVEPIVGREATARRVTVRVTEAKPLLVTYGLGYSTDDGPRGLLDLTHANLFGRVNAGSLRLRGSRREQLFQLSYTNLRPFGRNWPTTFSTFYSRDGDVRTFVRRRLVGGREEDTPGRSFGIRRVAAFVQTQRKLGNLSWVRFRYSFENAKLFNLEDIPLVELTRNERAIRLGLFSAGFSRDTRDSVLNPTRGQLISADTTIAARILGGNESFNKLFANYQFYETLPESAPLVGRSVFAMAARLGLAAPFSIRDRDQDGIISEPERRLPISERFFAGGVTTLRGFRFEEAGPQAVLEPRSPNELPTLVSLGGDALAIFNFELRYPLTKRLRLVPFYDLGNVFRRAGEISFGGMTNTLGLGLRVITPVGPVGIDYGYLLDPPLFVTASGGVIRLRRGVIHIRFGQTF